MDTEAKLRALREQYACRLPERVANLKAAWRAVCAQPADPAARQSLLQDFHSLAGSGSSFGFPAITQYARRGEALLGELMETRRALSARQQRMMEETLAQLDAAAQNAANTFQGE